MKSTKEDATVDAKDEFGDTEELKDASQKLAAAATLLAKAEDPEVKLLGAEVTDVLVRVQAERERLRIASAASG